MNKKSGFTLAEVLVSGTIVSLVAISVYSIFASGIHLWKQGIRSRRYQRNIRIFSDKLTRELRNTFDFSDIKFEGLRDSVSFAGLIENNTSEKDSYFEIGRIKYFLNEQNVFCRLEERCPECFQEETDAVSKGLISGVSQVEFQYCYLDNATGDYKWREDWIKEEQDTIPQAVKIELLFEESPQDSSEISRSSKFSKTIFIPIGTGKQSKELK